MIAQLVIQGVLIPLAVGIFAGLAIALSGSRALSAIDVALGVLLVYWLLEGVPVFPPAAVKQKLGYVMLGAGVLGTAALWRPLQNRIAVVGLTILLAAACVSWFSANVLARATTWEQAGILGYCAFLAVSISWFLARLQAKDAAVSLGIDALSVLLAFAMCSAIVALVGGFIGMGQLFGALAAFCGGMLLVAYAGSFRARSAGIAGATAGAFVAATPILSWAMMAIAIVVVSFATSLNFVAQTALPLVFVFGAMLIGREAGVVALPAFMRPVARAFVAAIPGVIAIAIAFVK